MKKIVVVLTAILLEIVFVVGCCKQEVITKTVVIKKGESVKESFVLLVPDDPLSIDHGKFGEKSLPKGVRIQGGSVVGVPEQNGTLKITLTWNGKDETYETEVSFSEL